MSEDAKSYNRQKHTKHIALGTPHKVGDFMLYPLNQTHIILLCPTLRQKMHIKLFGSSPSAAHKETSHKVS
jgi:hypothetical protein